MTGELGKLAVPAAGAAAAAAGLLYLRSEYEKEHFVTERYEIRSPKIHQPKRLVFLTDLHEKSFSRDNRLLREELSRIDPDFVLAGGDLVTCPKDREEYAVSLSLMRFLAERWPVYYAPGNHEDRMRTRNTDYFSELEKAGVTFLENESAEAAEDIRITGVRLDHVYYRTRFRIPVLSPGYLKETVGEADMERFQILLLHSPQFFEDCAAWGADLTLSGHFHGGTIRLPYLGGLMTPQFQFFRRECAGRFEKDGKTIGWFGIPYAKPPVGERRWKAPEALPVSEAVFEFAGKRLRVRDGRTSILYSDFVRGKHAKSVWVYRHGMLPIPGGLTFE